MNFFHVLTLVFVVAKLLNHFPYSWWAVFLPSIVGVGIGVVMLLGLLVAAVIAAVRL